MPTILRTLAANLPRSLQEELRRFRFLYRARKGRFSPNEPEAEILAQFVSVGDWVIDIGANVGQYTLLLSQLVGATGRVFAFEPMITTAATLASVSARCAKWQNVTVLNLAATEHSGTCLFELPIDQVGLRNFERARICASGASPVFGIQIDTLEFPNRISFVKIDAEGHENEILKGMRRTIKRDIPVIVVEDNGYPLPDFLHELGYELKKIQKNSPNSVLTPARAKDLVYKI